MMEAQGRVLSVQLGVQAGQVLSPLEEEQGRAEGWVRGGRWTAAVGAPLRG